MPPDHNDKDALWKESLDVLNEAICVVTRMSNVHTESPEVGNDQTKNGP